MAERNTSCAKLITIFFILAFPCGVLTQFSQLTLVQDSTQKDGNRSRLMFDGEKVADIIDYNDIVDLCKYKTSDLRNFNAPGRRVSEVKCLEYVWDSLQSEITVRKSESCIQQIIVGGRPAFYGEFPHMGAMGWRSAQNNNEWIYKCGAVLISDKFMLTAGHCSHTSRNDLTIASPTPEVVKIGDNSIINKYQLKMKRNRYNDFSKLIFDIKTYRGQIINEEKRPRHVPILRIIKHDQYKPPKRYYDIALIELAESVRFGPLIRPACLWTSFDTSPITKLTISGWGVTNPATRETATELQAAEVDLIDDKSCDEILKSKRNRHWYGLADHQICAGFDTGGVDTCQGDSGGPLQVKMNLTQKWPMYYLVGVTSFGIGCARANSPGVYVKPTYFLDWIENIVWRNAK